MPHRHHQDLIVETRTRNRSEPEDTGRLDVYSLWILDLNLPFPHGFWIWICFPYCFRIWIRTFSTVHYNILYSDQRIWDGEEREATFQKWVIRWQGMLGENVRRRREGSGGCSFFHHASLQIANERFNPPYQVYSSEPGSDKESKSRIKMGGESGFHPKHPFWPPFPAKQPVEEPLRHKKCSKMATSQRKR